MKPPSPVQHHLTLLTAPYFEPDGFPLAVVRMDSQDACPLHDHLFCEIVVVTKGEATHVVGRKRTPLRRGSILVIDACRSHAFEAVQDLSVINILFMADLLRSAASELATLPGYRELFGDAEAETPGRRFRADFQLGEQGLRALLDLVDALDSELRQRHPGFRLAAQNHFLSLVLLLSRLRQARPDSSSTSDRTARNRVHEAIRYFHRHFAEPIDLKSFPRRLGMSERNFRRAFHEATGYAPLQYLARLRVQEAAMQLRRPRASVTAVAMNAGFGDLGFFGRKFKEILGVTPHVFRQTVIRKGPLEKEVRMYPCP